MKYIILPFIALIISQIIKFMIESISKKKILLKRLFIGAGGIPSTHASFVSSFTYLIFLDFGFNSIYFAIALIFSLIVLYDAVGVRYEVELHAKKLNILSNKFLLNEDIGHNIYEVIAGFAIGILVIMVYNYIKHLFLIC